MPKRRSPLLEKVKRLMRISSISLTKMRRSARRAKKFHLLSHYKSYGGFIQECQFSPSDTPLIQSKHRKNRVDLYSLFEVVFVCLRAGAESRARRSDVCFWKSAMEMEATPAIEYAVEEEEEEEEEKMENEDGSVDERAQRFIDEFYQQIKLQRLQSSSLMLGD